MSARLVMALRRWVDAYAVANDDAPRSSRGVDWARVLPFTLMHAGCLGVLWVGTSRLAIGVAVALFALRMFAITAFYHRYFSHRAFRTSRAAQLVFAVLGASAVQRGPLWWASHHRHHHTHSDRPDDRHSARQHGFWWSHVGWFLARENFATRLDLVPDLARYPELRWIDRYDVAVPALLAVGLYALGAALARAGVATSGPQLLVWGFCVSTLVLYHVTFTINSLAHAWGSRRYATRDDSRNNWWLALLTFGEGWHNNHHHFPGGARQGFYWWEVDVSYYGLRLLALLGIVQDLRAVPAAARDARRIADRP